MVRHRVDLPEPDGPSTTTTCPFGTSSCTFLSTCNGPKNLSTPAIRIIGGAEAAVIQSSIWGSSALAET